ncbi:unnamed protein product, partial [Dovyalis caffra]
SMLIEDEEREEPSLSVKAIIILEELEKVSKVKNLKKERKKTRFHEEREVGVQILVSDTGWDAETYSSSESFFFELSDRLFGVYKA